MAKKSKPNSKSDKHPFEIIKIGKTGQFITRLYASSHEDVRERAYVDHKIPRTTRLIIRKLV
jgi:hypothetical protein